MGLKMIANDTLAPWNTKVVPPVTRGLEAWFTFDTDASRFGFNRAIGKPNGTIIGAPTAFATHGRFKGNTNYILTQARDTDEVTLFAVVRALVAPTSNADGVTPVSTYRGNSVTPEFPGSSGGANIFLRANSVISAGISRSTNGAYDLEMVNAVGGSPTTWRLLCAKAKSGSPSKIMDLTNSVSMTGTNLTKRILSDLMFRIGSSTVDYLGESDISAVAIYSSYLTDSEINDVSLAMRKRMSRLGISV